MTPWDLIGDLARHVPTPHNTQPFRIRPLDACRAEVLLCCDRLLPAEDPGNAYVTSAFGVFACGLERAGRATGHAVTVRPIAELDAAALHRDAGTIVLGEATLEPCTAVPAERELLMLRRTSRLPYRATLGPEVLAHLARCVEATGHRLTVFSDPGRVRAVLWRNARAIVDNLQDPAEREEIRGWHRLGATPQFGDGLWQLPMQQPTWQLELAFGAPRLLAVPGLRELAIARYLHTMRGTRHVAVLEGPFATWPERIAAGRALHDLWLAMAEVAVYMHPFGSMLTNPVHAAWVARELGAPATWLILRLGYSDPPPRSPRLASILVPR